MSEVTPGTHVGQYTIERDLTTGGMAHLFLARDAAGQPVVLKFPHISIIGDPALYDRYQRELEIGRSLWHPYIQHLLDADEHEGHPYMVLAYVEGESLRTVLSERAPLPVSEALHILDELCQGVAYCHERGVFHRDLKPENILLTSSGNVTIIDFGIARLRGARRITWAGLSSTVGTPDYMAPEQIQGKRGDARTDIYSLGAIGYEMLSGQPPFSGDNPLAVMGQHLYGTIRPLSEVNPAVPAALSAVIEKALARQPDERYHSAEEFREALAHFAQAGAGLTPPTRRPPMLAGHLRLRRVLTFTFIIGAILLGIVLLGVLAQAAHTGR